MGGDLGTMVTVSGMPLDEVVVREARRCGDVLAETASSPCHIGLQAVRRLGSEPEVEVTFTLEVHGAPVWAVASDANWSTAMQMAFVRVADRVEAVLDWGGSVDISWRLDHRKEQVS
jgi:hypothetical protein